MPYRRAYKRPRYGKRDKYSVQQKAFQFSADSGTSSTWLLVPATTLEGMRKVKHLMVNLTIDPDSVGPMWWAIVYVPQGTTVGSINVTTSASATGMYEPNQFVMNCGIADPTAGLSGSAAQSHATSTTETQSHWSSGTPTQQQELLWERVVMLSPSNKHQFTLTHRQGR